MAQRKLRPKNERQAAGKMRTQCETKVGVREEQKKRGGNKRAQVQRPRHALCHVAGPSFAQGNARKIERGSNAATQGCSQKVSFFSLFRCSCGLYYLGGGTFLTWAPRDCSRVPSRVTIDGITYGMWARAPAGWRGRGVGVCGSHFAVCCAKEERFAALVSACSMGLMGFSAVPSQTR